ncbi:MAG: hypothetical protein J6U96_04625 [Elusimicrobiaceae bacterium]|nr:hypothetical protein [Elusimicrobiaceae bacterium]
MRKTVWLACVLLLPWLLGAQTVSCPAGAACQQMPQSNNGLDSLKQAFAASDVSGAYSESAAKAQAQARAEAQQKAAAEKAAAEKRQAELEEAAQSLPDLSGIGMVPATSLDVPLTPNANLPGFSNLTNSQQSTDAQEKQAQDELDYAARMMQSGQVNSAGRVIPQAASQGEAVPSAAAGKRPFDPSDYRPGVQWQRANSTHFIIYNQKRNNGIGSSNMSMIFENAYATLRRNIPWMMADKVRVFVYQDYDSYLKHEPNAKEWTRALAYPTRGEIVVYDEPGKQQELKEVFTHELVHVFTQQFFDKYKTGRLMTPTWLDEGLAVYMEDQAYNGAKGGPWANDLRRVTLKRDPKSQSTIGSFGSTKMFGSQKTTAGNKPGHKGKSVTLMPFDQFMQEGSLEFMESRNKTQAWYLQAYAMVRFLLNPSGSMSPSNRMQFEQFTRLMAQGEQVRDPSTGFPKKDAQGKPVYQTYSAEKAMGRAYHYNNASNFEDAFWSWANNIR